MRKIYFLSKKFRPRATIFFRFWKKLSFQTLFRLLPAVRKWYFCWTNPTDRKNMTLFRQQVFALKNWRRRRKFWKSVCTSDEVFLGNYHVSPKETPLQPFTNAIKKSSQIKPSHVTQPPPPVWQTCSSHGGPVSLLTAGRRPAGKKFSEAGNFCGFFLFFGKNAFGVYVRNSLLVFLLRKKHQKNTLF